MANPPVKRCAIYTRKSSEEGLEQAYNSLDAQRDAGDAFVRSQKHEGWKVLDDYYDDGGISGGHMERPSLQRLLGDIEKGKIDVVVVYKVDRLSRSLADFSQLMRLFDKHNVSFVSVTQQFNTSSSMGRLTLNVLLSFAQFEREVTGERIRDKIALSKKKGMWMGGIPPLGYDAVEGKLKINPSEAKTVTACFETYLAGGGLCSAVVHLNEQGYKTKGYLSIKGRILEARPWVAKQLHRVLTQPIYVGLIRHKEHQFDGQHDAVVSQELWDKVQTKLRDNQSGSRSIGGHENENAMRQSKLIHPLKGFLQTMEGFALTPTYTNKSSKKTDGTKTRKRYRYYISQQVIGNGHCGSSMKNLNADLLEDTIRHMLAQALPRLSSLVSGLTLSKEQLHRRLQNHAARIGGMESAFEFADAIRQLAPQIVVGEKQILIHLVSDRVAELTALPVDKPLTTPKLQSLQVKVAFEEQRAVITSQVYLNCSRGQARIVNGESGTTVSVGLSEPNVALIQTIVQAEFWRSKLADNPSLSLAEVLRLYGITKTEYIRRLLNAAYLAPAIKRMILEGRQPSAIQVQDLTHVAFHDWEEQKRQLGFLGTDFE